MSGKRNQLAAPLKRRLEEERRREEGFALDLFLSAYGKPHTSPIRGVPGEQPDFVLEVDGELVGIELTEVVWSKLRKQEEFRLDIVVEARDIYAAQGGPPLEVHIQWHDFQVRGNRKKISATIVAVVDSMQPAMLPIHVRQEVPPGRLEGAGLPFIASISLLRKLEGRTNSWMVPVAGTVLELNRHDIESLIRTKENALRRFLVEPDCLPWLLIYVFDNRVSGSGELDEGAGRATYKTKFARVFVLNAPRKEIAELSLADARE